jgi:hypothetical protein
MKLNWKLFVLLTGNMVLSGLFSAIAEPAGATWDQMRPLVGQWKASGKGSPGEGEGKFSFAFDLQNRVLVRKSHTDYPAAQGMPAFAHDDLMVVYLDEGSQKFRADYFDNEGHVIHYTADCSQDGKTIAFVSDPSPSQPRFRLTYNEQDGGKLDIKFEIATPDAPDKFKVYVEGFANKI